MELLNIFASNFLKLKYINVFKISFYSFIDTTNNLKRLLLNILEKQLKIN